MTKPLLRQDTWHCEHGISGLTHPSCYYRFVKQIENGRVGYIDIEMTQLKADFGIMLSWAIKTKGKSEIFCDVIKKEDFRRKLDTHHYIFDYRITKSLIEKMQHYEWLISYYGTAFDLPTIRTRALFWKLPYPGYGQIKHKDLYYVARNKLNLHSNRLAVVSSFLGFKEKTPLEPWIWQNAMAGDEKALQYIKTHNIKDVVVLEKVHNILEPFTSVTRRSI